MERETLPDDGGMLFIHDSPGVRSMWMKDTPLSLDMLFIGPKGSFRRIVRNTVPESTDQILGPVSAQHVLELRGGVTRHLGIHAGDRVRDLPDINQSSPDSPASP